jgi:hypothetical protein
MERDVSDRTCFAYLRPGPGHINRSREGKTKEVCYPGAVSPDI